MQDPEKRVGLGAGMRRRQSKKEASVDFTVVQRNDRTASVRTSKPLHARVANEQTWTCELVTTPTVLQGSDLGAKQVFFAWDWFVQNKKIAMCLMSLKSCPPRNLVKQISQRSSVNS